MKTMILLTASNIADTVRTIDSYRGYAEHFVIGHFFYNIKDLEALYSAKLENVTLVEFEFNELFKYGFANIINELVPYAPCENVFLTGVGNDLVKIHCEPSPDYNCWGYQRQDLFIAHTFWNSTQLEAQWCIHEELKGNIRFNPIPHFTAAEIEKDPNPRYDEVREIVYYEQFRKVLDGEGDVNQDWKHWIRSNEFAIRDKIAKFGENYIAFQTGEIDRLWQ